MKPHFVALLVVFLAALSTVSASTALDVKCKKTLDYYTSTNQWVLVAYHSPSCSWSRDFMPIYEELATELNIPVLKVNVARYSVPGLVYYPTVRLFNHGVGTDYKGKPCRSCVLQWVQDSMKGVAAQPLPRFRSVHLGRCSVKNDMVSHRKPFDRC